MAMSANAARALEQVKMGLAILYGANYFTEDEWITIDTLIRHGQRGSKQGQPNHILDEPLISFDDSKQAAKDDVNIQDAVLYSSKPFERDAMVTSEKQTHVPVCSEPAAPTQLPTETLNGSSAVTSSCEGNTLLKPTEPLVENSETDTYSPGAATDSEREIWMHSSVSEVGTEDLASFEVAPPPHSKSPDQPYPKLSAVHFIRNDKPQSLDTSYEGNGVGPSAKLPSSRASTAATRTAHGSTSSSDGTAVLLEVTPGTILVAQSNFTKKAKVHVGVSSGDSIKVLKKVSGIMYLGENLTTKQVGQLPSSVFEKSKQARKKNSAIDKQRAIAELKTVALVKNSSSSSSSVGNDLDKVEGMNAAEWDKDDTSVTTATVSSSRHGLAGLSQSMFANSDDQSQCSEPNEQEVMRAMISMMLDEKLQRIQKGGRKDTTGTNRVSSCHSEARNSWMEPLKPVPPKTRICWFFATPNKECRFTAEECRDLHESYPSIPSDSLSLRQGKPSWGALADGSVADPKGRTKTCWYWANAQCTYTAETCRFLHEHVAAGVMPRPGDWKENRKREGEGESFLMDMKDGVNGGWGEDTADLIDQKGVESEWAESSPEKYKPPHIKALEEKARLESAGW